MNLKVFCHLFRFCFVYIMKRQLKTNEGGDVLPEKTERLSPDARRALELYGNSLYRLCSVMTGCPEDAQDAVQECFLRYITKAPDFADSEHEKAWLIRVASNICRDMLRHRKRMSAVSTDEIKDISSCEDNAQILDLLVSLDEKYRIVIHLHYVEGYKASEISAMLGISEAAVKKRLQRGRESLRILYEKEAVR